jgi:hypothetical protein
MLILSLVSLLVTGLSMDTWVIIGFFFLVQVGICYLLLTYYMVYFGWSVGYVSLIKCLAALYFGLACGGSWYTELMLH